MKYCDISHTQLFVELIPLPCIFVWGHRRKKQGSNDEWTVILVVRELENLLPVTMDGKEWPHVHLSIPINPTCFLFIIGRCQ